MTKTPPAIMKIDGDLLAPVKHLAITDQTTARKWLSDLVRRELNERQARTLAIRPTKTG